MKHVLITGGCGFIGSNFINHYFYKSNCQLVNIDAMYYCANEHNVAEEIRSSSRYTFIKGNIASFDLIQHILTQFTIDTVIHFAAQSHVETSFSDAL